MDITDIKLYYHDPKISDLIKSAYFDLTPSHKNDFTHAYGAMIYDLDYKQMQDEYKKEYYHIYADKEDEDNIVKFHEGLKKYADGFREGYSNFGSFLDYIKRETYLNKIDEYQTIYELITDESFRNPKPIMFIAATKEQAEKDIIDFGKSRGRMYKAWEIIFKHPVEFDAIFRKAGFKVNEGPIKSEYSRKLSEMSDFTYYLNTVNNAYFAYKLKAEFKDIKDKPAVQLLIALIQMDILKRHLINDRAHLQRIIENFFEREVVSDRVINTYIKSDYSLTERCNNDAFESDLKAITRKLSNLRNRVEPDTRDRLKQQDANKERWNQNPKT